MPMRQQGRTAHIGKSLNLQHSHLFRQSTKLTRDRGYAGGLPPKFLSSALEDELIIM